MNATEAARRAGYKYPNKLGPRLVKVGIIREAIDARLAEMAIPANEVLARLGDQASSSIGEFLNERGLVDPSVLKRKGHLVKRVTFKDGQVYAIELYDAQAALIHLDRHHGGEDGKPLPEVVEIDVREELARRLAGIAARRGPGGDAGDADG